MIILADNDVDGRRYADDVQKILESLTPPAVVAVVELSELPERGDPFDFIEARDSTAADDLRRYIETLAEEQLNRPPTTPVSVCMAYVKPEVLVWLWEDRFPLGKYCCLAGDPGPGKSFLTLDMAAGVAGGR